MMHGGGGVHQEGSNVHNKLPNPIKHSERDDLGGGNDWRQGIMIFARYRPKIVPSRHAKMQR
jgi:hypothetical protein